MDLTISSLTQIFTNSAKTHGKIVLADDLTESIRGGNPAKNLISFVQISRVVLDTSGGTVGSNPQPLESRHCGARTLQTTYRRQTDCPQQIANVNVRKRQ